MRNRLVWGAWLAVGMYVALIFGLSSIPKLAPPGDFTFSDKIAHFLEYGGLGVLLFRALYGSGRKARGRLVLITLVVGGGIAAIDEVYQGTVGRDSSVWDWVADSVGLAAACLLGIWFLARKGRP